MYADPVWLKIMINVIGSTPIPPASLPPELPGNLPIDPTQSSDGTPSISKNSSNSFQPLKKKRFSPKFLWGGLLLFLLIIGSGVGLYLVRFSQDLRQQASVYNQDVCGNYGGARCQAGTAPGDICDNNPPGSGVCVTQGQRGPDGTLICSCQLSDDDDNRGGGTCTEQCPASDGVLRSCSPPEADGTPQESICNLAGRVESCGGRSYCCPAPGAQWTTDMSRCEATACTQVAGTCIGKDNNTCVSYTDGCQQAEKCAEPRQECSLDDNDEDDEEEQQDNDDEDQDDNDNNEDEDDDNDNDRNRNNDNNDDDNETLASSGTTTSNTQNTQQPALPSQLPQSGPEDWLQYLQIGLGALGIGALLLLFL